MGKKGVSWFTAVKRVFLSPTKDNEKLKTKRREENQQDDDHNKRREKRWILRKQSSPNREEEQQSETKKTTHGPKQHGHHNSFDVGHRHALAMAEATAAAAQAAAATAQAAVEIIRLTRPTSFVREKYAAIVIQTAFRRYLARRALRALKGIVKLQALIRGHNVRTQTKMMLMKSMNSIARLQTQQSQRLDGEHHSNFSHHGHRKSMFAETNGLWESKYDFHHIRDRKSLSRDRSSINNDWGDRSHSLEGLKEMLQSKNEATLKREKNMAYANFSNQISKTGCRNKSIGNESELDEKTKWLDRWMATKQWQSSRKSPATPSPLKVKPVTVRSASPRCMRDQEKCYSTTHTPKFGYYYVVGGGGSAVSAAAAIPNYMVATESAKAKLRSQSVPRTRPSTPERERNGGQASAKKRLSYPEPQNIVSVGSNSVSQNMSFKSMEQQSNIYSYYTDSIGGQISPCSTTDLRRWLR